METLCRDCIFRVNDEKGQQIDCELGRLSKFEALKQSRYDETTLSYVITRFCNTCRNQKWLDETPEGKDKVFEQSALDYGAIIEIDTQYSLDGLGLTLSSLFFQTYHPKTVVVVYNSKNGPDKEQIKALRAAYLEISECPIKFTVQFEEADKLNDGVVNCDTQYYMWLKQGEIIPLYYSAEVNRALNDDLKQFVMARKNGIPLISRLAHDIFKGNTAETIIEKIERAAFEEKRQDVILEL